jgi:hypothetical protein
LRSIDGNPRSIDWSGQNQLVAWVRDFAGSMQVVNHSIGGDFNNLGNVPQAVRVISGDSASNVYVLDSNGELVQYRGYAWTNFASQVAAVHMSN